MTNKLIFIFLDGFGMGKENKNNPFTQAVTPFLDTLLSGRMVFGHEKQRPDLLLKGIDACLGLPGVPQSATGQTALFTGVNASKLLGYHLPAFPNRELVKVINEGNVLKNALGAGKKAIFANSYSNEYFDLVDDGKLHHSVTTHCVFASELPFKNLRDLEEGNAVHWDITRKMLNMQRSAQVREIKADEAGMHLAGLTGVNDLVLYECFMPDLIGHKRKMRDAVAFLELFDVFLNHTVKHVGENVTIVISSDHGNMEDLGLANHTRNPVPLLVIGKSAPAFKHAGSITDVTGIIGDVLIS